MTKHESGCEVGRRPVVAIGLAALIVGVSVACYEKDAPVAPEGTSLSAELATAPVHSTSDGHLGSGDVRSRFELALARTAWIGRMHNEVVDESRRFVNTGASRNAACSALVQSVMARGPEIDRNAGVSRTPAERKDLVRAALQGVRACRSAATMSVVTLKPGLLHLNAVQEGDITSDAALQVAEAIAYSPNGTDGYPASVQSKIDAIMANAPRLTDHDMSIVAAVANLTLSSSQYWSAAADAGELLDLQEPYSIFSPIMYGWIWIVAGDALGCYIGVQRNRNNSGDAQREACFYDGVMMSAGIHIGSKIKPK